MQDDLPEIDEKDEQRRDALLLKLLKTPPESREELKRKVRAWREQERASRGRPQGSPPEKRTR
jgi:hypothetical protein